MGHEVKQRQLCGSAVMIEISDSIVAVTANILHAHQLLLRDSRQHEA